MAIVGNTTIYESISTNDNLRACHFTMPEEGTITSISMYHEAGGDGQDFTLALFADNGGSPSKPAERLAITTEEVDNEIEGWQTINLITPYEATQGVKYWLAFAWDANPGTRYILVGRGDSTATSTLFGISDPFGNSNLQDWDYSIYCTYTASTALGLSGTVNGTSSVTGAIGANPVTISGLAGTVNGTSSVTGAIGANPVSVLGLVGTSAGISSVSGAIGLVSLTVLGLAGTATGISSVSGAISKSYSGVWQPPSVTYYHSSVGYYRLLIVAGVLGTPPPDGILDVDYELVGLLLPNALLTTKKLVTAGNDQIWMEE